MSEEQELPHRRRTLAFIVGGLIVVVAVVAAVMLWGGDAARPVDDDAARSRLDQATTVAPVIGELRPAQGLYRYRGGGTDRLNTPPKEQAEGPDMPATVTHAADGCWTFRIDYSTNHWQSWNYCPSAGGLTEMGGQTYQRWDFVVMVNESTSTFTCDDAVTIRAKQSPGDEWQQSCSSDGPPPSTTVGPYRFVGSEAIDIGGTPVEAVHYHRERTMAGGQAGTEVSEVWFAADTGLPLRNERRLEVDTDTIIGTVHYTEDANFELQSITPDE